MNTINLYIGTYHKYNSGSIFGEWVNLFDFDNLKDFYKFCRELHKDEEDPEFMFQDWEAPEELKNFVGESYLHPKIFEIWELWKKYQNEDKISLLREFNLEYIYEYNDEFFNTFLEKIPLRLSVR